ncbi:MAG: HAD family hydrolase [Halorientalis sp.]
MSSVEAVFLSLDGTLCEYRRPRAALLDRAFDRVGVDPFFTAEEYRRHLLMQVVMDETRAERREAVFTDLAERAGRDPAVGRRLAAAYAGMRDHGDVEALPGAIAAVESLADRYDLALVANGGPETQDPKLATLDLVDVFDAVVYGGYETPPKPEPGPFLEAIYALDTTPRRVVHVGDSAHVDVRGADAAGISAALVSTDDEHLTAPDYRVESMAALTDPPWE